MWKDAENTKASGKGSQSRVCFDILKYVTVSKVKIKIQAKALTLPSLCQSLEDAQRDQLAFKSQLEALTSECELLRKKVAEAGNEREGEVREISPL